MSNMPEKTPEFWVMALAWLSQHSPVLYAALLSAVMAGLRIIYGGGTRRQIFVEGAICGGLTVTLISGLEFFGLPQSMATFVGGWVGFLGVEKIRSIADRVTDFKLPGRKVD
ncbi:phage holin, lambda family [Pseudomonas proteolytica]|uniref:Phage holin, lambda family n=1 Tax=Pseudomonas proteolytica TaxID=219574 RepID=A0AAW5A1P5_9PSED|nr:phage holin, lambda family [Pseudomonas proteolytica]MCF5057488.1 phage holin, lambda family [Pseudomonas proteolytica]MCF5101877.1 phage holin, lambda family [Pseudomonas proteolytica]